MSTKIARQPVAKGRPAKAAAIAKKAVPTPSMADRARAMATRPLHCCLMQSHMFRHGIGVVLLVRQLEDGNLALAAFLVDVFCLGIKDVGLQVIEPAELGHYLRMIDDSVPMTPVDPSYARKLLQEAAAYGASLGLRPHRDFAAAELLFGSFRAATCTETFRFGCRGRPLYVPGPSETPRQVRHRLATLTRRLGIEAFDVALPGEDDEAETEIAASLSAE